MLVLILFRGYRREVFFEKNAQTGNMEMNKIEKRLVSFISENYKTAYHNQAKGKSEVEKLYLRLLLVTDYICGMTDSYAKRLYQELNAII